MATSRILITPLSHGLSYTTFELSDLSVSRPTITGKELEVKVSVIVKNTGSLAGSEVVQLYVTLPKTSHLTHAPLQLKAFAKVRDLAPGASQNVDLTLDKYATSYWDENLDRWIVERGEYAVRVGTSSDKLDLVGSFIVEKNFEWNGL